MQQCRCSKFEQICAQANVKRCLQTSANLSSCIHSKPPTVHRMHVSSIRKFESPVRNRVLQSFTREEVMIPPQSMQFASSGPSKLSFDSRHCRQHGAGRAGLNRSAQQGIFYSHIVRHHCTAGSSPTYLGFPRDTIQFVPLPTL